MAVRLAEGGPDLGLPRLRNGEGEHTVEVEAGRRDRDDGQHTRDEDGATDDVELLAVEHVHLDVEHGGPDPHGGHDLHEGEAPVGDEQLQALEQHEEGAHDQRQRGQPAAAVAELEHGLLDGAVVAAVDGVDQARDARADALPPGGRSRARSRRAGRRGVRIGQRGWAVTDCALAFVAAGCASILVVNRHWSFLAIAGPGLNPHHCRPGRAVGKGRRHGPARPPGLPRPAHGLPRPAHGLPRPAHGLRSLAHGSTTRVARPGREGERWRPRRGSGWRTTRRPWP